MAYPIRETRPSSNHLSSLGSGFRFRPLIHLLDDKNTKVRERIFPRKFPDKGLKPEPGTSLLESRQRHLNLNGGQNG